LDAGTKNRARCAIINKTHKKTDVNPIAYFIKQDISAVINREFVAA